MATKKPSTTKLIAEELGTDNKLEQLKRVKDLKQMAQVPSVAVTVLYARGSVQLSVAATEQVSPDNLKYILQLGVDEITSQLVRSAIAKESGQNEGPAPVELPEPGSEEEVETPQA